MTSTQRSIADGATRQNVSSYLVVGSLTVFALGIALRTFTIDREGLWMDEVYSATFASLPFADLLVAVLRFDVHPPLYYVQLWAWAGLGHSDRWLVLNSVTWSSATLLAVFLGVFRSFGTRAALLSLCFCALMGSEIYFAEEVRMYSMFSCLTVLTWITAEWFLTDYRLRSAAPLLLVLIALSLIHSISIIAVAAALAYVFPWSGSQRLRHLRTWSVLAGIAGIALLPWLINASFRGITHPEPFSITLLEQTMAGWILGYGRAPMPVWSVPLAAIICATCLVIALLSSRRIARLVCCFILLPLAFGAVISVFVRPVWLVDRTFVFCAPFLAIAGGSLFSQAMASTRDGNNMLRRHGSMAIATMAVASLIWADYRQAESPHKMQYREVSEYLAQHAHADELIYAPQMTTFWGIARYLIGPDWGNALSVQDPLSPDGSKRWRDIYARLGTDRLKRLHLVPQTRRLDRLRTPLIVGWTPLPELKTTLSYWVVVTTGVDVAQLALCMPHQDDSVSFVLQPDSISYAGLLVHHIHCTS